MGASADAADGITNGATNGLDTEGTTGPGFSSGGTAANTEGQRVGLGSVELAGGSLSLLLSAMLGGTLARIKTRPTVI